MMLEVMVMMYIIVMKVVVAVRQETRGRPAMHLYLKISKPFASLN